MAQRAAIVAGGSSGIGLGIARVLGEEGYGLTVAARRPEKLEEAVEGLRADGFDVNAVSGNLGDEAVVQEVVRSHRDRSALATKAAVVGFTQAMHKELAGDGIKSTALCPAFVDTPMTDFVKEQVKPEDMIQVSDVAETVRVLLRMSPGCIVPEVQFLRPGDRL